MLRSRDHSITKLIEREGKSKSKDKLRDKLKDKLGDKLRDKLRDKSTSKLRGNLGHKLEGSINFRRLVRHKVEENCVSFWKK